MRRTSVLESSLGVATSLSGGEALKRKREQSQSASRKRTKRCSRRAYGRLVPLATDVEEVRKSASADAVGEATGDCEIEESVSDKGRGKRREKKTHRSTRHSNTWSASEQPKR